MDIDQMLRGLQLKDLRAQLRVRGLQPGGGADELRARLKDVMMQTGDFNIYPDGAAPQQMAPPGMGMGGPPMGGNAYGGGNPYGSPGGGAVGNNYSRPGGQQNVGNFISDRPSSRVLAPPGGKSQISFGGPDASPPPSYQAPPSNPYNQPPPQQYGGGGGGQYGGASGGQYGGGGGGGGQYGGGGGGQPYQGNSPYRQDYPMPASQQPFQGRPMEPPPYAGNYAPAYASPPPGAIRSSNQSYGSAQKDNTEGYMKNNYSRPNGMQNVGNFITDRPSSKVLAPPGGKSQISFG